MSAESFTFIDLFAGIGGFHLAMSALGGNCVFASEIDRSAIDTYKANFGMDSDHNITKTETKDIPAHDVLCGGFPCQAFSKAGYRLGFRDATRGTLFFEIARILKEKKPRYFILENVRNLLTHDQGNTIRVIRETLQELDYNICTVLISPHQLGIPQLRERVYILGVRKDIYDGPMQIEIPSMEKNGVDPFTAGIFEDTVPDRYYISEHETRVLNCWDEFYKGIKETTLGFPIWVSEFGSDADLSGLPKWKADFCTKNRNLYLNNKEFLDSWLDKWNHLSDFTPTERKLEWQVGDSVKSIWEAFVQSRPSGIRVKRPTVLPTLVAIGHIPIIAPLRRRLTPREAARLQSFPDTFVPAKADVQAYKQFGNAVNVQCVQYLAEQLFRFGANSQNSSPKI